MAWLHGKPLLALLTSSPLRTHRWYGSPCTPVPPYSLLPGVASRDALALSSRVGAGECKKFFQALTLASLPLFVPGIPKEVICKHTALSFAQQHCGPLYLPATLSVLAKQAPTTGFRHCPACVNMAGEGWTAQVDPINPEKKDHRWCGGVSLISECIRKCQNYTFCFSTGFFSASY